MMEGARAVAAIKTRNLSSVEVMTAFLDHIAVFNPKVNAIVALQERQGLLAQARERDAQVARGEVTGPLHGLPHAVKDLQPVKGIRSTSGSPILKDFVPAQDSLLPSSVCARPAPFSSASKTNTPEFGLGSNTYSPVYGATHNAYDLDAFGRRQGHRRRRAVALALVHAALGRWQRLWRFVAQSRGLEQVPRLPAPARA